MSTVFAELNVPEYVFDSKYRNIGVVDFVQIVEASQKLGFKGSLKMVEKQDGFYNELTPRAIYFAVPQALAMLSILLDNPKIKTAYVGMENDGQNQCEHPIISKPYAGQKVGTATRIVFNENAVGPTPDHWYAVNSKGTVFYRGIGH